MREIIRTIAEKLDWNKEISQWSIRGLKQREYQFFASGLKPEEQRTVVSQLITVNIYYIQGKFQGMSSFVLSPHEWNVVDSKIEKALTLCKKLISNRLYFLPPPDKYPIVSTLDREIKEYPKEKIEELWKKVRAVFKKRTYQKLSTTEFFITLNEHFFLNSMGAEGTYEDSNILLDFVVTARKESSEAESHAEFNVRTLKNLDIEFLLEHHAKNATDKLSATLPPSGTFPVVISREALIPLFDPLIFHSSGKVFDMGITSFKKGHTVCRGQKFLGERITLSSNPCIPFGLKTFPFDKDGVAAKTVKIIEEGIFKNIWAVKEFADYLKISPTGEFGNLVIESGTYTHDDLLCDEKPLLHIFEFSFLHPDNASGDFVDEIRLGYFVKKGRITPVKGGSVSGNIFEALAKANFSREIYRQGRYIGPESMKLSDLIISGK